MTRNGRTVITEIIKSLDPHRTCLPSLRICCRNGWRCLRLKSSKIDANYDTDATKDEHHQYDEETNDHASPTLSLWWLGYHWRVWPDAVRRARWISGRGQLPTGAAMLVVRMSVSTKPAR